MLTESLSPLAQAVFGMTTLQRYNAPKISLAAFFSFLKTDRLVQALFTPPVVLKPCFLFPALSPCRQTKKEGLARPFVHTTVPPPRSLPTSRFGKEREGIGDGKGNPISGFPFPSQNMIFSQFRATAAGSVPSCWRIYSFMSSAMASSRLSVPGYAPLSSTVRKAFSSSGSAFCLARGCQSWKAARAAPCRSSL